MSPKHHYPPISEGDRKDLKKELSKSRFMTHIFAERPYPLLSNSVSIMVAASEVLTVLTDTQPR
jgi:hypothetical protein